jgi:hypothetical protein
MTSKPPRWDLSNVYPGLDSVELAKDFEWVKSATEALRQHYQEALAPVDASSPPEAINQAVSSMVDRLNGLL